MPIVGGLDIHRKQITFDYLDTATGQVYRGQVCPADREHLRAWLARFAGRDDVAFAVEGCTGWRYRRARHPPPAAHLRIPGHRDRGGETRPGRPRQTGRTCAAWLARFAGRDDVRFALEGCTGWRYVALRREALFVRVEVRDLRLRPVAAGR